MDTDLQSYVKPKTSIIPEPFLKKYSVIRASKIIVKYDEYYEEAAYLALNIDKNEFMTLYCPDIRSHET